MAKRRQNSQYCGYSVKIESIQIPTTTCVFAHSHSFDAARRGLAVAGLANELPPLTAIKSRAAATPIHLSLTVNFGEKTQGQKELLIVREGKGKLF
jgi:hypothetical protein